MRKILSVLLALTLVFTLGAPAFAASVADATINMSASCSIDIYKYDLTNAEKDNVWDSSYVSTGVRDTSANGPEGKMAHAIRAGDTDGTSVLGNSQTSNGYAIKGVEFSYVKIAAIKQYKVAENGGTGETVTGNAEHVEVLYGISDTAANRALIGALMYQDYDNLGNPVSGSKRALTMNDSYLPAKETGSPDVYYFQSDTLIKGLALALQEKPTLTRNALETYMSSASGTTMPLTDADGHTAASNLSVGLYLFVETKVPEMVTTTTAPFLVSLPMTSVNGTNVQAGDPNDGGSAWLYSVTVYPKNLTGIPTLEKTLREDKVDTGKNDGLTTGADAVADGYAHTATASNGDIIDFQIISTLPSITSAATYLAEYSFVDTLPAGLTYVEDDVVLEFFSTSDCATANKLATWTQSDATPKFTVSYSDVAGGGRAMTISPNAAGLDVINKDRTQVYTADTMINSGYSDCTVRITYKATMDSNSEVVYGDGGDGTTEAIGNQSPVVMTWRRTSNAYYDTLVDDTHVYTYGIDLTKIFSDGQGDFSKVEFMVHNDTDNYYAVGTYNSTDNCYYITDHEAAEADGTHFIPNSEGKLMIKGLEDDTYTLTEVRTDNKYTLLKENIAVVISTAETADNCSIYGTDVLGLVQNDPRYATIINSNPAALTYPNENLSVPLNNMPQTHLDHKLLTASSTIDGNDVNMVADSGSVNAEAPLTVVNTRGFDLPQTGGFGNWFFPVIGLSMFALCMTGIFFFVKKNKSEEDAA